MPYDERKIQLELMFANRLRNRKSPHNSGVHWRPRGL